jgi:hypothetical protein
MKQILHRSFGLCLIVLCLNLNLTSCRHCTDGKGELTTSNIDPGAFSSIKLKIPAKLTIEQGLKQEVRIEAQPNILKLLKPRLSQDALVIESTECIGENKGINIFISNPTYNTLVLDGSGSITGQGAINTNQLELAVNGSGKIQLLANSETLFAGIKGSGEIIIEGSTHKEYIRIDGSGRFYGVKTPAVKGDIQLNGSAVAEVFCLEKLEATVNGSGTIKYKGNPQLRSKINGSGGVNRLE